MQILKHELTIHFKSEVKPKMKEDLETIPEIRNDTAIKAGILLGF
jgi:hypothetical protein